MPKLNDQDVDALADILEEWGRPATKTEFANYPCGSNTSRKIGIMRAMDIPQSGMITTTTFGLAHNSWEQANFPDRIELVQGATTKAIDFERISVAVAKTIIERNELAKPGAVYQHAVVQAAIPDLASRMPHALILFPYLWEHGYREARVGANRIWFLQVVPIFDDEMEFVAKNGLSVFEELIAYHGAHFHDLNRLSYVQL